MKLAFALTAAGAIFLMSAGCTSVQETQQSVQPSARATMVENASQTYLKFECDAIAASGDSLRRKREGVAVPGSPG
jgi:hypothetical protein